MNTIDVPMVAADDNVRWATISNAGAGNNALMLDSINGDIAQRMGLILGRIATGVEEISYRQWQFCVPGTNRNAQLHLSARWLSIGLPMRVLPRPIDGKLIDSTLSRNARIKGSPRIIGSSAGHERRLVVDIPVDVLPWDSEPELDKLIAAEISAMSSALDKKLSHADNPRQARLSYEQLETIFEEAGWSIRKGEDDGLEVPLEVPGCYYIASLSQGNNITRLSVPIFVNELSSGSYASRNAITVLLWLITSHVRMVKPTSTRRALGLEVSLPAGLVKAASLAHACAALSATLQHFVAEAELLIADEYLAQIYLSNLDFQKAV